MRRVLTGSAKNALTSTFAVELKAALKIFVLEWIMRIPYTALYNIPYTTLNTALEHASRSKSRALAGATDTKMATLA
ncbi:hypothetical protein Y032_0014g2348 [Ancylostoma ceylanicum]|uniref:Uncharacterized protein n=1 Tax=Ancylostoma ceylanicum TaxID=53326 RepID=A0A016VBP5_9BILA|nr:hypothetical protein Y032_0014g2348 [Ancylostoma ceylanicum]